jgi:magnesium transporter
MKHRPGIQPVPLHLQTVIDLLNKHKLVEAMVRNQDMPRHDLVEQLVHKQHLAEIHKLLNRLAPVEIALILVALPLEDALVVWKQVDPRKGDDVLQELPESLQGSFAEQQELLSEKSQINAFELANGRLRQINISSKHDLASIKPIWIDLLAAKKSERAWIGEHYGVELPNPDDLTDLEASARHYIEESGEIHLHSDFLLEREGESRSVPVAFILHGEILFSVRSEELPVFRLQRLRARTQSDYVSDGKDVLLDLYAADAEYSADALEDIYSALGEVGSHVLNKTLTDEEAAKILAAIAREEDLNGRIRRNMLDTRRALSFLMRRGKLLNADQFDDARQILRDIESLDGHTAFLFDKINFLMDATVGFININQNKIIKIFSVASVALLPPTLIASIYGMNFKFLPELDWTYGYYFALALMITSVTIPIFLFKRKGWLK